MLAQAVTELGLATMAVPICTRLLHGGRTAGSVDRGDFDGDSTGGEGSGKKPESVGSSSGAWEASLAVSYAELSQPSRPPTAEHC